MTIDLFAKITAIGRLQQGTYKKPSNCNKEYNTTKESKEECGAHDDQYLNHFVVNNTMFAATNLTC